MDLGVLLESPQGSQSSSRMRACTCAFLQSGSSSVTQSAEWIKDLWFSLESFPRDFATRLSHRAVPRAHVVGVDPRLERHGSAFGSFNSDSSAFSKTSLNIRKFTVHVLLKPGLENFEHYFLACEMSAIVW